MTKYIQIFWLLIVASHRDCNIGCIFSSGLHNLFWFWPISDQLLGRKLQTVRGKKWRNNVPFFINKTFRVMQPKYQSKCNHSSLIAVCPCNKWINNMTHTKQMKMKKHKSSYLTKLEKQIKGKPTNPCFNPKVLIGCEEHIQLQQQWPQEMIPVKSVPTKIKLC